MQMVRIDVLRERVHPQSDQEARTPGGRNPLRVVRLDVLRQRLHPQPHQETPPWAGRSLHLVRVAVDRERLHPQSDGAARAVTERLFLVFRERGR